MLYYIINNNFEDRVLFNMPDNDYYKTKNINLNNRLKELLKELPDFCNEFFMGIEPNTSPLTRLNYAYDLRVFFNFLLAEIPKFNDKTINDITISDFNSFDTNIFEKYLNYLTFYNKNDEIIENHNTGKARKIASLKSFSKYYYKKGLISENKIALIDSPNIKEKAIVRLEPDEIANLIDAAESGDTLSKRQQVYHVITQKRDMAIITLFLGTGIRVSELVGLNIKDIDFNSNAFNIIRKGGSQVTLYFGEEVQKALAEYIEVRNTIIAQTGSEEALFLSLQKTRLTQRSIQNLVKKYSRTVTPLKNISPHKLRSTFGTRLYQESGDIYLVADVLGHKDVNTTRKHYAAMSDENRRMAAKIIKLRED